MSLSLGLVVILDVKLILRILINFLDSNVLKIKISQTCYTVFYLTLVFLFFDIHMPKLSLLFPLLLTQLKGLKFRNTRLQNKVAIIPDILINEIVF